MRYLATVAPLGKTDPAVWSSAFNDGSFETEERGGWKELRELNQGREREYASARGWARSRADGAAHGVELGRAGRRCAQRLISPLLSARRPNATRTRSGTATRRAPTAAPGQRAIPVTTSAIWVTQGAAR